MEQIYEIKISKEELMERIKTRCAKELKSSKLGGGVCLILLVFMITYMLWTHNATAWEYSIVILVVLIEALIEGWWSNRLSKCDDASTLVTTHEKYLKFEKVHYIIVTAVVVVLACLLFLRIFPTESPVFAGLLVCCCTLGCLASYNKRNTVVAQEINRLRELLGN